MPLPETLDLNYLSQQCLNIARQAGEVILQIYHGDYSIEEKADKTPLTEADIAAHNIIIKQLQTLTPGIPVLSEEAAQQPFELRQQWQTYWLVDPLDGTREFIKRNGEFTVNIALIHQHKSILGVIHAPVIKQDYYAWQGAGAFKVEAGMPAKKIQVRKLNSKKPVIAGSRSHVTEQMQNYLNQLQDYDLLSVGSSLKFCLIAEGLADLYPRLGPTSEWDSAAAHCIVEQAGGYISKTNRDALLYNTKDSLLNPSFLVYGDNHYDWFQHLEKNT